MTSCILLSLLLLREVDTPYSIQIPELEVSKVSVVHKIIAIILLMYMKVHAEITFDGDEDLFFVTDLGSRNGTFLNDTLLSEVCVCQLLCKKYFTVA